MIYKVSNKISDIEFLLKNLKKENENSAFISFVEGEYGMRVNIYNSHVKDFVNTVKNINNKTIIIGICFINHTIFLKDVCDYIIEIQDTKFQNSQFLDSNHITNPNFLSNNYYDGNDGWSNYYIRGIYCSEYENMLNNINFNNIFFTTSCDGSTFFSTEGDVVRECNASYESKLVGKIENQYYQSNFNFFSKNISKQPDANDIALHIRNTNKWPERNLPKHICDSIFEYCISNKINLHVFLDLNSFEIPKNEFIHIYNDRKNNIPNMDYYISIINNCKAYIGSDSGFTEMVAYYSTTPNILVNGRVTGLLNTSGKNINVYYSGGDVIKVLNDIL